VSQKPLKMLGFVRTIIYLSSTLGSLITFIIALVFAEFYERPEPQYAVSPASYTVLLQKTVQLHFACILSGENESALLGTSF
jgi:hypothetical protein